MVIISDILKRVLDLWCMNYGHSLIECLLYGLSWIGLYKIKAWYTGLQIAYKLIRR